MAKMDGGPAFPRPLGNTGHASEPSWSHEQDGMSLRDYFAAQALQAVIAAYIEANGRVIGTDHVLSNASLIAFKFADAMLSAREVG